MNFAHRMRVCVGYVNPTPQQFSVKKLYRDAIRLALHLGRRNGNAKVLREQVKASFLKHKDETDVEKIKKLKEDAVRGLSNYLFHEAQRMAKRQAK